MNEKQFLETYNPNDYDRPSVTVDTLLFSMIGEKLNILLIKRGQYPFKGYWALPGGFIQMDESADEAAARELKEETDIDDVYLEQLYTFSNVDRDPRMRVISISYMALVSADKLDLNAGDDAADARWFPVNGLLASSEELAFDHREIIEYAIKRLRGKIDYTDIAFRLLPDEFTMKQVKNVFEEVMDAKICEPNFRRSLAPKVIATGKMVPGKTRPLELYRLNTDYIDD